MVDTRVDWEAMWRELVHGRNVRQAATEAGMISRGEAGCHRHRSNIESRGI